VLSFNQWADWYPLTGMGVLEKSTVYDLLDQLISNLMLPIGGFAIALFAEWAVPDRILVEELRLRPAGAIALRITLRFIAPAGIAAPALSSLFA